VSDIEEEEGLDVSQHDEKYLHGGMSITNEGLEMAKI
jgi:hypothetical protein